MWELLLKMLGPGEHNRAALIDVVVLKNTGVVGFTRPGPNQQRRVLDEEHDNIHLTHTLLLLGHRPPALTEHPRMIA